MNKDDLLKILENKTLDSMDWDAWHQVWENDYHKDPEFMRKVIHGDPYILKFAVDKSRDTAITKEIFEEVAIRGREHGCIALYIFGMDPPNYDFLKEIMNDKEFIRNIVLQNGHFLCCSGWGKGLDPWRKDLGIAIAAITDTSDSFKCIDESLKQKRSNLIKFLQANGAVLQFFPENLKSDKEIVIEAVRQNGHVISYASEILRNDPDIIYEALKQDRSSIKHISPSYIYSINRLSNFLSEPIQ